MPFCCCVVDDSKLPQKMGPLKCSQTNATSVTVHWGKLNVPNVAVQCRPVGSEWMDIDAKSNQLVPLGMGKKAPGNSGATLIEGLESNKEYEFKCCALNSNGNQGPYSDTVRLKTLSKPSKLNTLTLTHVTDTTCGISWQPDSSLHSVLIKVRKKELTVHPNPWMNIDAKSNKLVPCGEGTAPPADAGTSTIIDLDPGTEYEIVSHGGNNVGWGPSSEPLFVSTTLKGKSIEKKEDNSNGRSAKLSVTSTSRTNVGLKWEVEAGEEAWFVAVRGRRRAQAPPEPTNLPSATAPASTQPTTPEEWQHVDAFAAKLVPSHDAWALPASRSSVLVKKLDEGTIYEFSACVLSPSGYGSWSKPITVTTQVGMPPLVMGKITATTVHFEWTVSPVAVNVAIRCRKANTDDKWLHVDKRTSLLVPLGKGIAPQAVDSAIVLRGLTEKTMYECAACARTTSGWGPYGPRSLFETPPANVSFMKCLKSTGTSLTLKLNVPVLKDGDGKASIKCRKSGDASWMDIDPHAGKLVASGMGAPISDGTVTVEGLEENSEYEIKTLGHDHAPISVILGKEISLAEPPASSCAIFRRCRAALISKLAERPILLDHLFEESDKCFCHGCHTDCAVYKRGSADYIIPTGWSRIGIRTCKPPALEQLAFRTWHTCYHGTSPDHLYDIMCCGQLLKPGSTTPKGGKIPIRDGHIQHGFKRTNAHNGKSEYFDPRSQIFFSPSIRYCDYGRAYMTEYAFNGHRYRFALQVKIQPGTYTVGQETVGAKRRGDTIDPFVPNSSIEWYTGELHTHMITGILVNEK